MKLVLSRKGFDSQYGGIPSPILPDGRMISFPIPSASGCIRFQDLSFGELSVAGLVEQLSKGKVRGDETAHFDPDLESAMAERHGKWIPAFGQVAQAQSHLKNQGVSVGDLFLFFGWFREIEKVGGTWRYRVDAPNIHALFGWLKIEGIAHVGADTRSAVIKYPNLAYHPHLHGKDWKDNNTIYYGRDAGMFRELTKDRMLTAPGKSRSLWKLPICFAPRDRVPLSYHKDLNRWELKEDYVELQSVAKGQEFVLDLASYTGVHEWIDKVLS